MWIGTYDIRNKKSGVIKDVHGNKIASGLTYTQLGAIINAHNQEVKDAQTRILGIMFPK